MALIREACQHGCRKTVACQALGITIRTLQRWERQPTLYDQRRGPKLTVPHQLTEVERASIIRTVNLPEYASLPVCQIVPKLADKGIYIASESTFYRTLKQHHQLKPRGRQRQTTHAKHQVCVATQPNQVWSWDISYLPTLVKGMFYYLYLFMDIFSRKIVGFDVHEAEKAAYASKIIEQACMNEHITKEQVTLHSDNGSPMKGATFLTTLRKLGISASYSRPSVSNDNPYSEAMFKTLKYCHWYPETPFCSLEEARAWVRDFAHWYNHEHLHSGLNFITPHHRHQAQDSAIIQQRIQLYEKAKQTHPQRWCGPIRNWSLPKYVYLNPPKEKTNDKKT